MYYPGFSSREGGKIGMSGAPAKYLNKHLSNASPELHY
jgi:hypothetical protein